MASLCVISKEAGRFRPASLEKNKVLGSPFFAQLSRHRDRQKRDAQQTDGHSAVRNAGVDPSVEGDATRTGEGDGNAVHYRLGGTCER